MEHIMSTGELSFLKRTSRTVLVTGLAASILSSCGYFGNQNETIEHQCYRTEFGVPDANGTPAKEVKQSLLNSIYQAAAQRYTQTHPDAKNAPDTVPWNKYTNATDAALTIDRDLRSHSENSVPQPGDEFWYCINKHIEKGQVNQYEIVPATPEDIQRDAPLLQNKS